MSSYSLFINRLIIACFLFFPLTGCSITHVLNIDMSPLQTGSPLREVPSKTFLFYEFEDVRATDEVMNNWGAHHYQLDKSAGIVVGESIRQEFERNGHKCVSASSQSNIDYIVKGKISKYWFRWIKHEPRKTVTTLVVELTVSDPNANSKRVYSKTYEGDYRFTGHKSYNAGYDYQGKVFTQLLKRALMQIVIEISTDSDLIEFLEKG